MRRKPSLGSLRAGQTLYTVDHTRTALFGRPVLSRIWLCNEFIGPIKAQMLAVKDHRLFYNRRPALRAARSWLLRVKAATRDRVATHISMRAAFKREGVPLLFTRPIAPDVNGLIMVNEAAL